MLVPYLKCPGLRLVEQGAGGLAGMSRGDGLGYTHYTEYKTPQDLSHIFFLFLHSNFIVSIRKVHSFKKMLTINFIENVKLYNER